MPIDVVRDLDNQALDYTKLLSRQGYRREYSECPPERAEGTYSYHSNIEGISHKSCISTGTKTLKSVTG